jgi:hypothetical protein
MKMGEYYMVTNPVWKKAGVEPNGGMLCIGCLEDRLGRLLIHSDFLWCPLNVMNVFDGSSERLRKRLGCWMLIRAKSENV